MKDCEDVFCVKMREIEASIRETGSDPYTQLSGYIRTGNDIYITCHNNARTKIKYLDVDMIGKYIFAKKI